MAQTVSEAMVDGVLGDLTMPAQEPLPPWADMMESVPRISAVAGMKAYRGSGTILKGGSGVGQSGRIWGRGEALNARGTFPGATREGWRQANYLNPRNWGRFGSQSYFHHTGPLAGPNAPNAGARGAAGLNPSRTTNYTPFYMAAAPNWVGRQFAEGGRWADSKIAKSLKARELLGPGGELVSPGFYSRVSAAGRLGWMSDKQFARSRPNTTGGGIGITRRSGRLAGVERFLHGAGYSDQAVRAAMSTRHTAGAALMMSGSGAMSGRVGGFMAGVGQHVPTEVLRDLHQQGNRSTLKGFSAAKQMGNKIGLNPGQHYTARQMAQAGFQTAQQATGWGAKAAAVGRGGALAGARIAGLGIPGLNIILGAWLVKDLAELGVKGIGHGFNAMGDAIQSLQGDMKTGIMERGFTDTEATMTSRARGVNAIQNSRLNARSILGNEAGAMHAHFG